VAQIVSGGILWRLAALWRPQPLVRLAGRVHPATREFAPPGEHRFVAASANLQPAVAIYHRAPGEPVFRLVALEVLRIEGGRITEIVDFNVPHLYGAFGLAPTLP
jgi:hypothetical protein